MRNNAEKKIVKGKAKIISCAMIMAAVVLTGCGTAEKQQESSGKKIVVGVEQRYEPYTYMDINGDFVGIDIEIAKQAFGELGYEPEFQVINWEDKDLYLNDGTIDCIWSCYTMTDREDKYQWAGPYMHSRQVVAVKADSEIYELSDLAGKSVGVQVTTKGESMFLEPSKYALPEVKQVVSLSRAEELFAILRKGYVDAIAAHEARIGKLVNDGTDSYRMLEDSPYVSELGVAFKKGTHQELAEELTEELESMKQDGSIGKIAEKYGLDSEKVIVEGTE